MGMIIIMISIKNNTILPSLIGLIVFFQGVYGFFKKKSE